MNKITIVSAIAGKRSVTLYTDAGKELNLPAQRWKTHKIIEDVTRQLARGGPAELNLTPYAIETKVEKRSKGMIKFLRGAVDVLTGNTTPSVAIINGVEVEGLDQLESYFAHAEKADAEEGDERHSEALTNFLQRLAAIASERKHTTDELLRFLERNDMPLAKDGSIIAYKRLQSTDEDGIFVDCHSRKVRQRVGSEVCMPRDLIDDNRRNECSQGLHIARRGYLGGFVGDVIVLVRIAPEDVIAVPEYDSNKMRVARYQILAEIPKRLHAELFSGRAMTGDSEGAQLVGQAIDGQFPPPNQRVTINGPYGTDLVIEDIAPDGKPVEWSTPAKPAKAVEEVAGENAELDVKRLRDIKREETSKKAKTAGPAKKKPKPKSKKLKATPAEKERAVRDAKILKRLQKGQSQRQIAKEMNVCAKTVRKVAKANGM